MNKRALVKASLIAGIIMGIGSNLFLIHLFNCVLFGWAWSSTIFATWLYKRDSKTIPSITPSQGAIIGLLGGLVGVVVFGLVYFPYSRFAFGLGQGPNALLGLTGAAFLAINIIGYPLFGAIGGAIGGTIFKNSPAVPQAQGIPTQPALSASQPTTSQAPLYTPQPETLPLPPILPPQAGQETPFYPSGSTKEEGNT